MTKPKHNRRSTRFPHYDYGQAGAYFITVCVKDRICVLGEVIGEDMQLGESGKIVKAVWDELPEHYENVELGEFVVMPNHVHGIIWITETENTNVGAGLRPAPTKRAKRHGLSEIVRALKSFSARKINIYRGTTGSPFWQRGYYEHVIRNDKDLFEHRKYIINNPLKWHLDEYFRELEIIQV